MIKYLHINCKYFIMSNVLSLSDVKEGWINYIQDYPKWPCNKICELAKEDVRELLDSPHDVRVATNEEYESDNVDNKDVEYSILDLPSVHFSSVTEMKDFIRDNLWINLNKSHWMSLVNQIFQEVISLYEKRYCRQIPSSIKGIVFKQPGDIYKFVWSTWKWRLWVYKCDLSKLFFSYAHSLSDPRVSEIAKNHNKIVQRIEDGIQVNSTDYMWVIDGTFTYLSSHVVDFNIFSRPKSKWSIVGKEIADVKYSSVNQFKDLHWATIEVKDNDVKWLIYLLQHYYIHGLFLEDWLEIENKWLVTVEDVESTPDLDEWFKNILLWSIKKSQKKQEEKQWKKWTSKKYKDIKIKWFTKVPHPKDPHKADISTWLELKFTLHWNENEHWDSFHPVLDYKKRFRELTRLSWMIRQKDIVNYVNEFFGNLEENLRYKRKKRHEYLHELYEDLLKEWSVQKVPLGEMTELFFAKGLYNHFVKDLIPVRTWSTNQVHFIHKNYITLSDSWVLKEKKVVK